MVLPGMVAESPFSKPNGKVNIDLDDQDNTYGRAISYDVFKKMVNRFNSDNHPRPNENVAYIIDKQLLHILLSSRQCRFLMLAKCLRPDKETDHDGTEKVNFKESIAFIALKGDHTPVGTVIQENALVEAAGSDVSAGEWIQGYTFKNLVDHHIIEQNTAEGAQFNFDEFFTGVNLGTI